MLAVVAVAVGGCQAAAVPTPVPGSRTVIEACHLPGSAEKGGQTLTFDWRTAVRQDTAETTVVLFVSGLDDLLCEATHNPDGTFGSATTGLGRLDPVASSSLTYDTGRAAGQPSPQIIVVGRMPSGTESVEVSATDGARAEANLGGGFYLGRLASPGPAAEIVARAADGAELARLSDPDGLSAGSAAP